MESRANHVGRRAVQYFRHFQSDARGNRGESVLCNRGKPNIGRELGSHGAAGKMGGVRKAERDGARVALSWFGVGKKFRATTDARLARVRGSTARRDLTTFHDGR